MLRITIRWRNLGPLVEDPSCSTTSCHWQGVRFREDRPPGIFGGAVSGAGICLLIKPIIITTLALVDVCVCVCVCALCALLLIPPRRARSYGRNSQTASAISILFHTFVLVAVQRFGAKS